MFNSRLMCILYLDATHFNLYIAGTNGVLTFDLTPFTANFEIINHDELSQQLKAFIEKNKVPLSNIVIVLSENILFVKSITASDNREEEEIRFSNNIPFEHVSHRVYPIENGALIVAANKDFYTSIQNAFEKNGFTCGIVVPVFTSGVTTINPQIGLDLASAKNLLAAVETLKQNSLETRIPIRPPTAVPATNASTPAIHEPKIEKTHNSRMYILAGILGLLVVILVFVLLNNSSATPSSQKPIPTPQAQNTQPNRAGQNVVLAAHASHLDKQSIQIVIQSQKDATTAAQIKQLLTTNGFNNITIVTLLAKDTTSREASSQQSLLFSSTVSQELQRSIIDIVRQKFPSIITLTVTSLSVDSLIIL